MAQQANCALFIDPDRLSWLPGALGYGERGAFPGGMGNNLDYFARWVTFGADVSQLIQDMLWTPETSGGLLIALPPYAAHKYQALYAEGRIVGEVREGDGRVHVGKLR
jgi:selenide,water dikinase